MIDRLYEILGVKRNISEPDLKAAYLRKAKQTHPDAGGNVNEFQDVSRAYDILGDPLKRIAYDQTGQEEGTQTTETAAVTILRNLVEMIIADNHDPVSTDFAKEMRGQLDQGIVNTNKQEMDLTRKIIRCKTLTKRFTAKSGQNLVIRIIEGRISEMERQIVMVDMERANIEAAITLLSSYEYRVDQRPVSNPYYGMQSQNGAQMASYTGAGWQS